MKSFRCLWSKAERRSADDFIIIDRPPMEAHDDMPKVFRLEKCNGLDLYEVTVDQLQNYFSNGDLTAAEYAQFCLENIRKTNQYLECVIETNPDAIPIATALDQERRDGKIRGPLHGIPVLVKDNMATADKMETTAGSWALLGSKVPKDAHIVHRLREAGAVILGKANMDEWAGARARKASCGWSARGGQCRNAYILSRSPQGSSGGSAVAVTSNLVPVAVGTETDCSVISPAMVDGIVGIKPTVGLTSRAGVIPISETQDTVGTFGRTVADAALTLDAIAGPDPDDKYTVSPNRHQPKSYLSCLADRKALKGAKFGLPMNRFWECAPTRQRKVVEFVFHLMKNAGAKIYEVDMPCAEDRIAPDGEWDFERHGSANPSISEITVINVQMFNLTNQYLSNLTNTPIKTFHDIVKYNDDNTGSEGGLSNTLSACPDGQDVFRDCAATNGVESVEYHAALKHITSQCRENGIDAALKNTSPDGKETDLDALLFCDVKRGGIQIAAQAGHPIITIPVGLDPDGMPVSLVLIHSAWQEEKLVKWASAIEDLLRNYMQEEMRKRDGKQLPRNMRRGRIPPTFMNHLAKNVPVDECYNYPAMDGTGEAGRQRALNAQKEGRGNDEREFEEWEQPRYLV